MVKSKKPQVNWTKIEESIFSIGIGVFLIVLAPLNVLIYIISGIFIVPGAGYLLAQPEVRLYLKLGVNFVSRKPVFKDVTASNSNVVGIVNAEGRSRVTIQQGLPSQKAPFLRPVAVLTYMPMGDQQFLELAVDITNIGDGIATDIEGQSILKGPEMLTLPNSGMLQVHPLGPGETKRVRIIVDDAVKITRQFYNVTLRYRDTNRKDVQSTGTEGLVKDLKLDNFLQGLGFEKGRVKD